MQTVTRLPSRVYQRTRPSTLTPVYTDTLKDARTLQRDAIRLLGLLAREVA